MSVRDVLLTVKPIYVRIPPKFAAQHMRMTFEIPLGERITPYVLESMERLVWGETDFLPTSPWRVPVSLDPLNEKPAEIVCTIEDDAIDFGDETRATDSSKWICRAPLLDRDGMVNEGYTFFAISQMLEGGSDEREKSPAAESDVHVRLLKSLGALYNRKAECSRVAGDFYDALMAGAQQRSDILVQNLDACAVGMLLLEIQIIQMPPLKRSVVLPELEVYAETEYLAEIPGTNNLVAVKTRAMPVSMRQMILKEEQRPEVRQKRELPTEATASSARKFFPTPAVSPFPAASYRAAVPTPQPPSEQETRNRDNDDIFHLPLPKERRKPDLRLLWSDDDRSDAPMIKPNFAPAALEILTKGGFDVSELTEKLQPAVRSRWRSLSSKQISVLEVDGASHTTTSAISARTYEYNEAYRRAIPKQRTVQERICQLCGDRTYRLLTHEEKKTFGLLHGQTPIKISAVKKDLCSIQTTTALSARIFDLVHSMRGLDTRGPVAFLQLLASDFREHLAEACETEEIHGLFLSRTVCFQLLTLPQAEAFIQQPVSKILSSALLTNLPTWPKRRRVLFFLIQHIAHCGESKALGSTADAFNHPISEFLHRTVREAIRGVQDTATRTDCLEYLTELFWMLATEAVRLVRPDGLVAPKLRPSPTEGLLFAFIKIADQLESELPGGSFSFVRVFSCHLKFKETLVAVTSHITANRMDTAERRTDRMRQYLTSRSMQNLHPANRTVSDSLHATPTARTRVGRRSSSVAYLQSDEVAAIRTSPSDDPESGPGTQATAPLDEALDLPSVGSGVSLNWLQSQISSRPAQKEVEGESAPGFLQSAVASFFGVDSEAVRRAEAVADFERRLSQALRSTRCFAREDLLPSTFEDRSEDFCFPMPLNAKLIFKGIDVHESFVIRSSKYPLVLTCRVSGADALSNAPIQRYQLMFKSQEDLRQDVLIIKIMSFFESEIFGNLYGIDTYLSRYQVLPLSCRDGLIEFVPGAFAVSQLRGAADVSLQSIVHGSEEVSLSGVNSSAVDSPLRLFLASSAAYSVMTYVMGVGDRHQDNLMVDDRGRFFHIDYGYIFGNDPKPFASVPMKITKEMIACMGGLESKGYEAFCLQCVQVYQILRKHHRELIDLLSFTFHSQIPDIQRLRQQLILSEAEGDAQRALVLFQQKIVERLRLDLDEAEAFEFLINEVVNVSVRSLFPVVVDKLHDWVLYWR